MLEISDYNEINDIEYPINNNSTCYLFRIPKDVR